MQKVLRIRDKRVRDLKATCISFLFIYCSVKFALKVVITRELVTEEKTCSADKIHVISNQCFFMKNCSYEDTFEFTWISLIQHIVVFQILILT